MTSYTDSRHAHPLARNEGPKGRVCDICRGRGPNFYQCAPCGWDCCETCFVKANPSPSATPALSPSASAAADIGPAVAVGSFVSDSRHPQHQLKCIGPPESGSHSCDVCRGKNATYFSCSSCNWDLCKACYDKALPAKPAPSSPSAAKAVTGVYPDAGASITDARHAHSLVCTTGSECGRHTCDICRARSDMFFICKQCNWDMCKACYDKGQPKLVASTPAVAAAPAAAASPTAVSTPVSFVGSTTAGDDVTDARHAHPLKCTTGSETSRHRCDVCNGTSDMFFICKGCNWDLCKACYDKTRPAETGSETKADGKTVTDSRHEHALTWREGMSGNSCDVCRGSPGKFFECQACDWDLCMKCYESGLSKSGSGESPSGGGGGRQQQPQRQKAQPAQVEQEPAPNGVETISDPRHPHELKWRTLEKSTECSVCERKRRPHFECKPCNYLMCAGCAADRPLSKSAQAVKNVSYLLDQAKQYGGTESSQTADGRFLKPLGTYDFYDGRKLSGLNFAKLGLLETEQGLKAIAEVRGKGTAEESELPQFEAQLKAAVVQLQTTLESNACQQWKSTLTAAIMDVGDAKGEFEVRGSSALLDIIKAHLPADKSSALLAQFKKEEVSGKEQWEKGQKIAVAYKHLKKESVNYIRVRPGAPASTGLPYRQLQDERSTSYWDNWRKPHAGKILFAKANIEQLSDPASTAVNSFVPGDEVFGRAIWPVAVRNMAVGKTLSGDPVYPCEWILADSYGHVTKHLLIFLMRVYVNGNIVSRELDKSEVPEGGFLAHSVEAGPIPPGSSRGFGNHDQHHTYKLDPKTTDFWAFNQSMTLKLIGPAEENPSKWRAGMPMLAKRLATLKTGKHKVKVEMCYWVRGQVENINDWRKFGKVRPGDDVPYDFTFVSEPIATGEFEFVVADEAKLAASMKTDPMPQRKTKLSDADADKAEKTIFSFMSKHRDWGARASETETVLAIRVKDWQDYGIEHELNCPKIPQLQCRCPRQYGLDYWAAVYRSPLGKWDRERPVAVFDLAAYSYEKGVLPDAFHIGVSMDSIREIDVDSIPDQYWEAVKRCPAELRKGIMK